MEQKMKHSARIKKILALHFNRENGTPYWLEKQKQLGFNVAEEIASVHDFHRIGIMDINALRTRPLEDFLPRSIVSGKPEVILSETAGTTGPPCRRIFTQQEFNTAFVHPWLKAVERFQFPQGGCWLFVGPGGPHIIDRAARAMARAVGSMEPYTVDCDVRWIKRQKKNSLGFNVYMDHVLDQAMNIIETQPIDTLFTTPPLLVSLAERMKPGQRSSIRGIHTGGLALSNSTANNLRHLFSEAVILPGYGNSLFGVTFPASFREKDTFIVEDDSLLLQLAPLPENAGVEQDITTAINPGERGRIIVHRLDPSFLILNLPERDTAVLTPLAGNKTGLQSIEPLRSVTPMERQGVY